MFCKNISKKNISIYGMSSAVTMAICMCVLVAIFIASATVFIVSTVKFSEIPYNHSDQHAICYVYNATTELMICGTGCNNQYVDCTGPTRPCYGVTLNLIVGDTLLTNPEATSYKTNGDTPYLATIQTLGITFQQANETIAAHPISWSGDCYYDDQKLQNIVWYEGEDRSLWLAGLIIGAVTTGLTLIFCAMLALIACMTSACIEDKLNNYYNKPVNVDANINMSIDADVESTDSTGITDLEGPSPHQTPGIAGTTGSRVDPATVPDGSDWYSNFQSSALGTNVVTIRY